MSKIANQQAISEIMELQKGVHIALDQLINRKDYHETEVILRQLDQRMVRWINDTIQVD